MKTLHAVTAIGLVALATALARPAHAGAEMTGVAEAKRYFETGRQFYETSRFALAASAFEEAYRLSPKPQVLFSLAQAHRQQYIADRDPARLSRAVELFREYVRLVESGGRRDHALQHLTDLEPQLSKMEAADKLAGRATSMKLEVKTQLMITSRTPGALVYVGDDEGSEAPVVRDVMPGKTQLRVEAEGFIPETVDAVAVEGRLVAIDVNLKEIPALLTIDAPEGADIALDGRIVGTAPLIAPIEVASGRHLLVVLQRGSYGFSRELTLARGEERVVEVELATTTQRSVSWWFLGGGGALVTAGAVAGVLALSAEGDAQAINERRLSRQGLTAEDLATYRDSIERRDSLAPAAYGLLGAGAASAITGLLLYLVDTPRVDIERTPGTSIRASLGPAMLPDGVGAALSGSF
ncbi:PEGA domain-containing protein [Myxococcota bacterium]|nr:PEGA domain-containing protein [Myxococcota bacterium]